MIKRFNLVSLRKTEVNAKNNVSIGVGVNQNHPDLAKLNQGGF